MEKDGAGRRLCVEKKRGGMDTRIRGERTFFFQLIFFFSFLSCSSFPFLYELSICPIDLFILWDIILFVMGQQGSSFLFPLLLLLSSSKVFVSLFFFQISVNTTINFYTSLRAVVYFINPFNIY